MREQSAPSHAVAEAVEDPLPAKDDADQTLPRYKVVAEAAKKAGCPWPPRPESWRDIQGECLETLNRHLMHDYWPIALKDPLGDWTAVSAAFDNDECQILSAKADTEIDPLPSLYDLCAAESMVRLAVLQRLCARTVVDIDDLQKSFGDKQKLIHSFASLSVRDGQAKYHRLIENRDNSNVETYWKAYMCRSAPRDAFQWIAALPPPAIKPGDPPPQRRVTAELPDGRILYARLPGPYPWDYTQERALFRAARRAGADVSKWWKAP